VKLLVSAVVRGDRQDLDLGGLYLVDLDHQTVDRVLSLDDAGQSWANRGRELGVRGIAIDGDRIYCMAGDELFAFGPDFALLGSWRNPYLKFCRGIAVFERKLFVASAGFDSVVAFDLDNHDFDWALQIQTRGFETGAHPFDPTSDDGPIMLSKLDIRDVFCDATGMYITAERGLIRFSGNNISTAVELPPGTHNARPYRDGVLFNDSLAGVLRYAGRGEGEEDRAMPVPHYYDALHRDWCNDTLAVAGFARGLCQVNATVVAGGSSPAAISLYDLAGNRTLLSVRLSQDARTSIHSIAIYDPALRTVAGNSSTM
jgi:hypothetical protein